MPIDMYGERRQRDLQARRPNVQYMAGLERAQGIGWCLNYIHSMKYAEVINVSIAANSVGIHYSSTLYNCLTLRQGYLSSQDALCCPKH